MRAFLPHAFCSGLALAVFDCNCSQRLPPICWSDSRMLYLPSKYPHTLSVGSLTAHTRTCPSKCWRCGFNGLSQRTLQQGKARAFDIATHQPANGHATCVVDTTCYFVETATSSQSAAKKARRDFYTYLEPTHIVSVRKVRL